MSIGAMLLWGSLTILAYTYLGYPILLKLLHLFFRRPVSQAEIWPTVTLIIAAYNEEKDIGRKLDNSRALDYPYDKLQILVVSDGSTDATDTIVQTYGKYGVHLLRVEGRRGKTAAQNAAVLAANGEILIFSDATSIYETDVVKKMVRNFFSPEVGCVSGRLRFERRTDTAFGGEKNTSEAYDQALKKIESDIYSIYGVNGCLYAVRKSLYSPLPDHLTSDFVVPLQILAKKYRVIFEPEAVCYEQSCKDAKGEFQRKIRTSRAGITGMYFMRALLNPFRHFWPCFGLTNHKIIRWLSPHMLILAFLTNSLCVREGTIYSCMLFLQILFYLFAILGYYYEKSSKKVIIFTIPFNFLLINFAAICGLVDFLRGNLSEAWEPDRT